MLDSTRTADVLWYEVIGFGVLIVVAWSGEMLDLPRLIFGGEHSPNWRESTLQTAAIIMVALPVLYFTKRMVARLHYLEGFLTICAWCKTVHIDGQWLPVEEFFLHSYDVRTSHGVCPRCLEGMKKEVSAKGTRR